MILIFDNNLNYSYNLICIMLLMMEILMNFKIYIFYYINNGVYYQFIIFNHYYYLKYLNFLILYQKKNPHFHHNYHLIM